MARIIWIGNDEKPSRGGNKRGNRRARRVRQRGTKRQQTAFRDELPTRTTPEEYEALMACVNRDPILEETKGPSRPHFPFTAQLDLLELEDRDRATRVWTARAIEIGGSHLIFRSRRMCHLQRNILVAVHLIDDKPVPLFGTVVACEYDRDGMHLIELALLPVPSENELVAEWLESRNCGGDL